jgi:hypothetical protein
VVSGGQQRRAKVAQVALTRHLVDVIYQMWKQEIDYVEVLHPA